MHRGELTKSRSRGISTSGMSDQLQLASSSPARAAGRFSKTCVVRNVTQCHSSRALRGKFLKCIMYAQHIILFYRDYLREL